MNIIAGNPIITIAGNEFRRIIFDPLAIAVFIFLLIFMFLNSVRNAANLPLEIGLYMNRDFSISSFNNILYNLKLYCSIVAVFIGAMSLAEERSRRSFSILLTKPLYRRDIILGKFLGLNAFMLLFVAANCVVYALFIFLFARMPDSMPEFVIRFVSLVLIVFFECALAMGTAIMAGILFKNVLQSAIMAVTYLFVVWQSPLLGILSTIGIGDIGILLDPSALSFRILSGSSNGPLELLDTSIGYMSWLGASLPFLVLMVLEILVILIVDCMVFIRNEEA